MKINNILVQLLLVFTVFSFAQNASDYFPNSANYIWKYETYNLDVNQNRVDESRRIRIDSLAGTGNFYNRFSNLILSKVSTEDQIHSTNYRDSIFISFDGSNALEYFNIFVLIDSADFGDTSLTGLAQKFSKWYDLYRFAQPINSEYQLVKLDTIINYQGVNVNVIGTINGKRENDEFVNVTAGSFLCKRFKMTVDVKVKIQLLPPPIPPLVLDVVNMPQLIWITENNWIVKEYRPTVITADLSLLGIESYTIYGAERNLLETEDPPFVDDDLLPLSFELRQNYPNPFNPSTVISYQLSVNSKVYLKIYDVLGRDAAVLVSEYQPAGNYQVEFNAEGLSSGIYYYRLEAGSYNQTRKMILLK